MNRSNTPWQPVTAASLEWTEEGAPRSLNFGDIYYSRDNGLEESRYVFLQGNGLPERWHSWPTGRFCIGETGFGTGLNFLLTWQVWQNTPEPRPDLHYLSVEKYPLARADLERALALWPALAPLARELLEHYPGLLPGQHRLLLEQGRVTLDLWWEDVADALPDLAGRAQPLVDAWYLDGFAPAQNEDMWQATVLNAMTGLSRPGATFSTFTAAGQVRRQLASAGFAVSKVAGYGRKRECLRGALAAGGSAPYPIAEPAWDLDSAGPNSPPERILVLGAGLAGCTVAAAMARRGIPVTLLDQSALAGGGSGNDQGILYTRLSHKHAALGDFSLQSYCFSTTFYNALFASGALFKGRDGDLCGSFHQGNDPDDMIAMATRLAAVPELAQVLTPTQAHEVLGIDQPATGYWYPGSGWLHPAALCRLLARQAGVELIEHCGALSLQRVDSGWQAVSESGSWQAACAIIATGTASSAQPALQWLPLQSIRGQTSNIPAGDPFCALRTAFCHEGYIAPAAGDSHCIGASFNLHDEERELRAADHSDNLDKLARAVPEWADALAQLDPAELTGRVGYRCASPDYLPLVGPVPDRPAFMSDYAALRKNARHPITTPGQYLPDLYLSTGHGSRGLTSTPLAAELLASQICGEPPPLSRELARALSPARFIIRDLRRNRI